MADKLKLYAYDSGGVAWELDLPSNFEVSLTFNFLDLSDISKKQRVYSNNIELPSTRNNDRFFLDAYDFKTNLFYNHKKHIKAYITDDAGFTMLGRMFLLSAKKNNYSYSYSVVFIGETADIIGELGDKTIRQILNDIGETFNYTQNEYNNNYSSPNDYGIALIDNNDTHFTYLNGGSIDGIGVEEKSLIPVMKLKRLIEIILGYVNFSIDTASEIYTNTLFSRLYLLGDNAFNWRNEYNLMFIGWNSANVTHNVSVSTNQTYVQFALYDSINYIFNNEVSDTSNIHNISTNQFTFSASNWKFIQNIKGKIVANFVTTQNFSVGQVLNNFIKLRYDVDDVTNPPYFIKYWTDWALLNCKVTNVANVLGYKIVTIEANIDITFTNIIHFSSAQTNVSIGLSFLIQSNNSAINTFTGSCSMNVYNTSQWTIYNNVNVPFDNSIPIPSYLLFKPETKASDVLIDFFRAFNFFVSIEPITKKVKINSFSTFFDNNVIDANNLIDDSTYEVILNNEYQTNELRLNWKEQTDFYSKTHIDYTGGLTYGGRKVNNDNEYSNNEKEIKTNLLSTIALVNEGDGFIRNAVYLIDNGQKKANNNVGLRLLLLNGLLPKQTYINYFTGAGTTLPKIAMYSHYDTSDASSWAGIDDGYKTPQFNLNFGFPEVNWYSQSGGFFTTNNDIYRNFFYEQNQIYNTINARVLKCKMFIPAELKDILTLRRILFYDGAYWIVNKIEAFKGFGNVYNVELIKKFKVDLPETISIIEETGIGGSVFSTNRLMSISNEGVDIIGNNVSVNKLVSGDGSAMNMRNRTFIVKYDAAFEISLQNEVVDTFTIIIDQLPDNEMNIYLNGVVFETITSATTYTMRKKGITTSDSTTTNTVIAVPVNPLNTQGQIKIIIQSTQII